MDLISGNGGPKNLEACSREHRHHGGVCQVEGVIDLDRGFHGAIAAVGGPEVDDIDEEETIIGDQVANLRERQRHVQQVIDGLA